MTPLPKMCTYPIHAQSYSMSYMQTVTLWLDDIVGRLLFDNVEHHRLYPQTVPPTISNVTEFIVDEEDPILDMQDACCVQ